MRTLKEALDYLNYHAPDEETKEKHLFVNQAFHNLLDEIWESLPEGPGKTVAIRAIGAAKMQCNSCIANKGN
jgi:hypothetical protein